MTSVLFKNLLKNIFNLNTNEKWTFLAQTTTIFYGIIIFLLQSSFIDISDLSIWFIFISVIGFTGMLEFGMNQLISRHITYLYQSNNQFSHIYKTKIDFDEFLNSAQYLNKIFSLFITSLSFIAGILYFELNSKINMDVHKYFLWVLCCIGFLFNNLNNFYTGAIQGINKIVHLKKIQISSIILSSIISLSAIHFGIYSFVVAYLATSIFNHILLHVFYKKNFLFIKTNMNKLIAFSVIKTDLEKNFFNIIAYKLLTNGYFLILGLFLTTPLLNSFGITNQIITYIYSFAFVWITANFPELSSLYAKNELQKLKRKFQPLLIKAIAFFILSVIIFLLSYKYILGHVSLINNLLDGNSMYLFILYIVIEVINGYFSQLLIILNKLQFMYLSFIYAIVLTFLTYTILHSGYSLNEIFLLRIILSVIIISIPIILVSYNQLRK